jgi:hypothetical protein
VVKIPFVLNEADISADAIVLMPMQGVLDVSVETPQGDLIDVTNVANFPTVLKVDRANMTYYRMTLPVQDGVSVDAHTGTWHLVLKVDRAEYKRYLTVLGDGHRKERQDVIAHGVKFTGLVHAFSNVRMRCALAQDSYQPGARLRLRCQLSEYGQLLPTAASVRAELTAPGGATSTLLLTRVPDGSYQAETVASFPGVYSFLVSANGMTSRNAAFTRQQVVTGAVWRGGDEPPPNSDNHPGRNPGAEAVCHLMQCIAGSIGPRLKERLEKDGWAIDRLSECICK